ncbi:MAG: glycoside hydrolase family 2 TIM barrel-domain containing protein [Bryobacteraceae bacterium]
MESENGPHDSLSRRSLLGQAIGAAGIVSALQSARPANAQTPLAGDGRARVRESFDFGWKFLKADAPGAEQPGFDDSNWRNLDLPHDWSIEGPFSEQPGSATFAHLPTGIGWYRKHFSMPGSFRNRKGTIDFDGVYQNSEVWINGQYLGKRPYGYISFHYDLTPYLNMGGENVIAVKVDNSHQPNCRWYSGSGIYRHTWLLVTNPAHVAHWGTFVTTPEVAEAASIVQVKTMVQNEGKSAVTCTLSTTVLDRDGKVIRTADASQSIAANAGYEFVQQIRVERPNLWSIGNPYLYKVRSKLKDQDRVVDEYDTPFGIRSIEFDADKGCLLNGKPVKLNGVCLHHEAGSVGAAVPERVWERRLELLKAMGCNSIRTSHNPYAPEFLDLCDRMGFLVMSEAFDEWKVAKPQTPDYGYRIYFDEWSERDVTSFIHRDRNHPSVALWSAGNEVVDQVVPAGVETLRRLLAIFHREDPTRLVTVGCDRIVAEPEAVSNEFLELLDVVGYNYVDRWRDRAQKYYSIDRHAFPHRKVIGTESPSMGGVRGDYRWAFPQTAQSGMRGMGGNRGVDVERLWSFVRTYDYVSGDHMWTGIDYLGESGWPAKSSSAGVLDTCGFEKDGYYFYQSQWTTKPMIHLFPHWNWKGKEGEFIPVLCYTNCDTVELFLNGKSLGVQGYWFPLSGMENKYGNFPARAGAARTTADLHLTWTVPYQPGTLKAVGVKDGKVVSEVEITTVGEPAAIGLSVDRSAIFADRRDVAHVTVQILDAQGRVVPDAANEVTFRIQGAGKIIGLDNGNPVSHEDFKGDRRKAFNGLCLAIVQSAAKPGRIQMTATSPGLQSGSITITTSGA